MNEYITAMVMDGFHKGHVVRMQYHPTLRLLKPKVIRVDYCCGEEEWTESESQIVEYKECFRAVDRKVVLYSEKGESMDIIANPSYFSHQFSDKPWSPRTTLKMGYHNEPIIRIEGET